MTQLTLTTEYIALSLEERAQRGQALADALRYLDQLDEEHKQIKAGLKKARAEMALGVTKLAEIVRSGREERPIEGLARTFQLGGNSTAPVLRSTGGSS